jgi:hypothetical protein
VYNGHWYPAGEGSPVERVIRSFEERVSLQQSNKRKMDIHFTFPRQSAGFKREQAAAARLLDAAEFDLDLFDATMDVLFTHKDFSWKVRTSLMHIEKDFVLAKAIVLALRKQAAAKAAVEQQTLRTIQDREDIFSY